MSKEEIEVWRDVPGHEGVYQVSDLGRVRKISKTGAKILKQNKNADGYLQIRIARKTCRSHRLILMSFIPNTENKKQVNHINGIRDDNRVINLQWSTPSENVRHAYDILHRKSTWQDKRGKLHHLSKKVVQKDLLGNVIKIWDSMMDIQRELGYGTSCISKCISGKYKQARNCLWELYTN